MKERKIYKFVKINRYNINSVISNNNFIYNILIEKIIHKLCLIIIHYKEIVYSKNL